MSFDPAVIEAKWRKRWQDEKVYRTPNNLDRPKCYVLDMFPYPSGAGLHVGHPLGYIGSDIIARFKRMTGHDVLHPMGWDAFGLPAENYAIKTGTHPRVTTEKNIQNFHRQLESFGFSYDWERELSTVDPKYYKWTQWIFVQLFKQGLAYEAEMPINWCPSCKTGLANEEVVDGACERCGTTVVRKDLRQWVLRITKYADRLLAGLKNVHWPEKTRIAQENWIGRSEGTEIHFGLENKEEKITVFTTRIDTIYGCTYVVLAPEHPLVSSLVTAKQKKEVEQYIDTTKKKSDLERTDLNKDKTGVFTGSFALNPYTNEYVPIWLADYVLGHYGTGAVMAVPAHDERDFEFAQKYQLPIKTVIVPEKLTLDNQVSLWTKDFSPEAAGMQLPYCDDGICINSDTLSGLTSETARKKAVELGMAKGFAQQKVNYRLHDWVFSRQRYWGEPIPIVHCESCGPVAIPEEELPLLLPEVEKYEPTGTGESPLASITEWVNTTCPKCQKPAKRETNTMPQWAGSCWYFLRFIDPFNEQSLADYDLLKRWMPVDMYIGGSEHAVLHLLYARFWNMFLYDIKVVPYEEPFKTLKHQGIILGENSQKMSKSRGNVVNPDVIINQYGADTFRLYEMFMGPFTEMKPWSTQSIEGVSRFLSKVWRLLEKTLTGDEENELTCLVHKTIKKVGEDIEALSFNTAISQMMILVNALGEKETVYQPYLEALLKLLAPFAPHISEELWEKLGHTSFLVSESWPHYENRYLVETEIEIPIQVNGKVRDVMKVAADIEKEEILSRAKASPAVAKWLESGKLEKEIYIPGKMVNLVVK
ncbi:MAG: leucine--tRNA ligase [Candidatus Abawacabacteria bacterium]|nr:leucine--tRNA ligase [Candidatus Abawacabacteria bacterium]